MNSAITSPPCTTAWMPACPTSSPPRSSELSALYPRALPIYSKRVLFDIGAAGPLAGFVFPHAGACRGIGVLQGDPQHRPPGDDAIRARPVSNGSSSGLISRRPIPRYYLHPVARAAGSAVRTNQHPRRRAKHSARDQLMAPRVWRRGERHRARWDQVQGRWRNMPIRRPARQGADKYRRSGRRENQTLDEPFRDRARRIGIIPWWAMLGLTLENANPRQAPHEDYKPASGPAAPISKQARLE